MLQQIKTLPSWAGNIFRASDRGSDVRLALVAADRSLEHEWCDGIGRITGAPDPDLRHTEELQEAVEHLTDCHTSIRRLRMSKLPVSVGRAVEVIATLRTKTTQLISSGTISSIGAKNVALKTLNHLFVAEQRLKQTFLIDVPRSGLEPMAVPATPTVKNGGSTGAPCIKLSTAMMFGWHHSLFPAERMIVGAGSRTEESISVDALFDVTGIASAAGVRADPDKLARALIAMAQSGTYFALWIHSHPGLGPDATHQSRIDLRQHADWLRDYSQELVSAIMVGDGYFRFWGTALENGKVELKLVGDGVSIISARDHVYRLEV